MKTHVTQKELREIEIKAQELARKVCAWLNTPEGQQRMREGSERVNKTLEELRIVRRIDPQKLLVPFGPADGSNNWDKFLNRKYY